MAQAALDPLAAAMCTLDQIHEMVEELFEAEAECLPQFRWQAPIGCGASVPCLVHNQETSSGIDRCSS